MNKYIKHQLKKCVMSGMYEIDSNLHPSDAYKIADNLIEEKKNVNARNIFNYIKYLTIIAIFNLLIGGSIILTLFCFL